MRVWSSGTFGCSLAAFVLSTNEWIFKFSNKKKRKAKCSLYINGSDNFFSAKELLQNNELRIHSQGLSFNRTDHFTRHKNNEINVLKWHKIGLHTVIFKVLLCSASVLRIEHSIENKTKKQVSEPLSFSIIIFNMQNNFP